MGAKLILKTAFKLTAGDFRVIFDANDEVIRGYFEKDKSKSVEKRQRSFAWASPNQRRLPNKKANKNSLEILDFQ